MEAVKKNWFWGIFISILAIIAMSHNASAIEPVFDISNYDLVFDQINPNYTYTYNDSFTETTATAKLTSSRNQLLSIMYAPFTYKGGDIVQTDFIIYDNGSTFTTGQTASGSLTGSFLLPYINFSSDYAILDVQEVVFHDINKLINYYESISCHQAGTGTSCETYPELSTSTSYYQVFRITLKIKKNNLPNYSLTLNSSTSLPLFDFSSWNFNYSIRIKPTRWNVWRPTETQENKEVEEKTQSAVDDSQAAGGSSSTDAQTGTTGLLNAITGAVNVISAARPTNCKINGNMGNLDMGQLDLCANPAPAFIQTIGSLILILMCVPLAISLFNRFITIFRSFQS